MKTTLSILAICALFVVCMAPFPADAWEFNKNHIISDGDLTDQNAMGLTNIKHFLSIKNSGLDGLRTKAVDGTTKTAARIIYDTSKKYHLSPKFFLTMIQKESGLVERGDAPDRLVDWVLGYAVCDNCSKDDPNVVKYKGFSKQLDAAGNRVRNGYLKDLDNRGYTVSGWGPGITKTTVDGIQVTPKNDATAVLYTYNPWVGAYGGGDPRWGANSLFAKKWAEYFPGRFYPNGSLLQDEDTKNVYLIQYGKKYRFESLTALYINYNPDRIIGVSPMVLDLYESGGVIKFPNYSLLQSPGGTVYLYVDGVKRGIVSKEVLRLLGYNPEEIIQATWSDLNRIPDGSKITSVDTTGGALVQDRSNGSVQYLDVNKVVHPIWDRAILDTQFKGLAISVLTSEQIAKYKVGDPIKMKDGSLITAKGDPRVYVISDGRRRPIASADIFNEYGYRWDQIIWVPMHVLELHPLGGYIK